MNWEMISAIGQMLGAIGVIISIVYLAAQIRNQNKESQRQAMHVLTTHWSDLNRTLVENPEMTVLWLRALRSFDDLDAESKLRFGAHLDVSCDSLTASILTCWMECSTSDCGADTSAQSPTL
jgi:heme/copper-type cytochrome/quinol oxidase subunit 1